MRRGHHVSVTHRFLFCVHSDCYHVRNRKARQGGTVAISVVWTSEERLVSEAVLDALRGGLEERGSCVLLVPTFGQALDAQRVLAGVPGMGMAVSATTPFGLARERWEVWGDGRALADDVVLSVLARNVLVAAEDEDRGPLWPSEGHVRLLSRLVDRALPWLPLDDSGRVDAEACRRAGLTQTEALLMGLAGRLGSELAAHGYVAKSEAMALVPRALDDADVPPVVMAGFSRMERRERELVLGLSELCDVRLVAFDPGEVAGAQVRHLARQLCAGGAEGGRVAREPMAERAPSLAALLQSLFVGEASRPDGEPPVELLCASGPVAEAELVAGRVAELARTAEAQDGVAPVVLAVPDCQRAQRELVPKLAARGLCVRSQWTRATQDVPATQAFLAFARSVAALAELAQRWPQPREGLEGPVPQLGDMSWWPPRDLMDFLLSEVSHMSAQKAWRLDAQWRGNRLLTPAEVLETLQSERETSGPVARATRELLRGRIGSAASKLLAPYATQAARHQVHGLLGGEAPGMLQGILRVAGTLRTLGVSADPADPGALPLSELVRLCEWAVAGSSIVSRTSVGEGEPQVLLMSLREAAALPPCSAHALVAVGCTAAEQPLQAEPSLLEALLDATGVEPTTDALAAARAEFVSLVGVARERLVFERSLTDADGKEAYPSVMLTELLAAYGIEPGQDPAARGIRVGRRAETDLGANRMPQGTPPTLREVDEPAPAGQLTPAARRLVVVPQNGRAAQADGRPVLSASQIETYLECPLKWFSLRRLGLGTLDAGHGGMEMGTFAHRVLEKTHCELFARAVGASDAADERLLRKLGEAHLLDRVEGSRVSASNLDLARSILELEFDLHAEHMYLTKRPGLKQQVLVAHSSAEREQERRLKQDLLSSLEYEAGVLDGFEPRLFEWGFGRGAEPVEYAGAYIMGTVDRIDVGPNGTAVIVDYKHKNPKTLPAEYDALQDGVLEGLRLPNRVQSLVYAQVVRRAFEGRLRLVGTVYLGTKGTHALAGAADENAVDLVFGKVSTRREPRVSVPRAEDGSAGLTHLLDQTEELIAEQVEQMMAGNVEARPRDPSSCSFCPVMQCERRIK